MWLRTVSCDKCGVTAYVRAYGPIEYERRLGTEHERKTIQLIIDCPRCGVRAQFYTTDTKAVDE